MRSTRTLGIGAVLFGGLLVAFGTFVPWFELADTTHRGVETFRATRGMRLDGFVVLSLLLATAARVVTSGWTRRTARLVTLVGVGCVALALAYTADPGLSVRTAGVPTVALGRLAPAVGLDATFAGGTLVGVGGWAVGRTLSPGRERADGDRPGDATRRAADAL